MSNRFQDPLALLFFSLFFGLMAGEFSWAALTGLVFALGIEAPTVVAAAAAGIGVAVACLVGIPAFRTFRAARRKEQEKHEGGYGEKDEE